MALIPYRDQRRAIEHLGRTFQTKNEQRPLSLLLFKRRMKPHVFATHARSWKPPYKVLHIDMDAFFASVELARHPELRGKPVCVGGTTLRRGIISAASYEARKHGIHSAMPTFKARRQCPQIIILPGDMELYLKESRKIRKILHRVTSDVEFTSVDEAYVGLSGLSHIWRSPEEIALFVKEAIAEQCNGITASIGIGPTKTVAKVASDFNKPDGLVAVSDAEHFLRLVGLSDIPGIGRRTTLKLKARGIRTVADAQKLSLRQWGLIFGKQGGRHINRIIHGRDSSYVCFEHEPPKSISKTRTLFENTSDTEVMLDVLSGMCNRITSKLYDLGFYAKTISIIIKYADFRYARRDRALPWPDQSARKIFPQVKRLLRDTLDPRQPIRMIGMAVSNFVSAEPQRSLFNYQAYEKEARLLSSAQEIRRQHGRDAVYMGARNLPASNKRHRHQSDFSPFRPLS